MTPAHADCQGISQPIAAAALLGRSDQGAAFVLRQILAHPDLFVPPPAGRPGLALRLRAGNEPQTYFPICSAWHSRGPSRKSAVWMGLLPRYIPYSEMGK